MSLLVCVWWWLSINLPRFSFYFFSSLILPHVRICEYSKCRRLPLKIQQLSISSTQATSMVTAWIYFSRPHNLTILIPFEIWSFLNMSGQSQLIVREHQVLTLPNHGNQVVPTYGCYSILITLENWNREFRVCFLFCLKWLSIVDVSWSVAQPRSFFINGTNWRTTSIIHPFITITYMEFIKDANEEIGRH